MAARNDELALNSGTVINISTFGNTIQSGEIAWCYANGTNRPITVFNKIINNSEFIDTTYADTFEALAQYNTYEYFQTPKIQALIDELDVDSNKVHWLWGSLKHGGVYIRRDPSEGHTDYYYRIGGVSGFIQNIATEEYRFEIREASRVYPISVLGGAIEMCFGYSEDSINSEFPHIAIFSLHDMHQIAPGSDTTYYAYKLYNQITTLYTANINTTSLYPPTRYITWEGVLGDKPSMILFPQVGGSVVVPYNLAYDLLGWTEQEFTNVNLLSGSPYGYGLEEDEEEEDPTGTGGYSEGGGGGGSYPSETGNVDFSDPTQMGVNVINSGFVTLYNPTLSEVKSFNTWLFNDVTDVISGTLKKLIADPIDYVLFLSLCHFNPPNSGAVSDTIHFAGINTTVTSKKITNQFAKVDCGVVHLPGDTQTFLDYNPNTKISIYLPYIGINELNSDDVVGSNIHVMYYIDLLTGACICQIKCTRDVRIQAGDAYLNDVIYSFSGNCYEQIPITGTDWRGLASSIMQGVSGAISLATGNLAGAGAIASAVIADKNSVSHSGNMGGSFGYMDSQKPYLIIERPINNNPYNFRGYKGYTLNMRRRIGNLKGYTEIDDECAWIDNFNGISREEAEMLKRVLSTGFYL